jgi:glutaredoxin 3
MAKVLMYSTAACPFCVMAERLLQSRGVAAIEKIRVDLDTDKRIEMMQKTQRRTVPQIYIGDTHVGGYDDLSALDRAGKLTALLAENETVAAGVRAHARMRFNERASRHHAS